MTMSKLNKVLMISLLVICTLWLVVPFTMAVLWSLVDPSQPWTADKLLPPAMSFYRWIDMWQNSSLKSALFTSYALAPSAAVLCLLLAAPTAFALGRFKFPGREVAKTLCLLPLVVPPFITSIFFSSVLFQLGFTGWRFGAILFAHAVLFLPYAIRILTVSFEQVRQEHIDAARDLGASHWARFRVAYLPALKPGIFAALLIVFIQSIEEFAIAFIVGSPSIVTIPTLLFSALGQDFVRPNAAVLSLILVVPNVILMLVLEWLLKSANPTLSSGKG
ncbi:spermidine/putrescine ABC transporter permease [Pseudovibrio japonicus]|uniref:Spermidine/putrescine ABC transporter permease n=1 Tax=Pseudovibrio japonicus TaxID=366534 RepID=A0ABQ3EK19_9HYPH|nr:ABC transporter permease subunit [Pseudovibrio japonicus]GHB43675.1 spermidine/putrescine ABC transporter permease [Pseudovibrio japonicus]